MFHLTTLSIYPISGNLRVSLSVRHMRDNVKIISYLKYLK